MQNKILRKGLVVGITVIFIGIGIIPSSSIQINNKSIIIQQSRGNTLYVGGIGPNNYTTLQSAIDDTVDGDTVFVYDDSSPYYENVLVNKTINLIGENKETTIIDGNKIGDVIYVKADLVNISGFKIRRSGGDGYPQYDSGIDIVAGKLCVVSNNILVNNHRGICIRTTKGNRNHITNNTIENNYDGIHIDSGSSNILSYNNIEDNVNNGIYFYKADNNDIIGNKIINNQNGIVMHVYSHKTYIYENNIDNNGAGIGIRSSQNIIVYNNIKNNSIGIGIDSDTIEQEVCYNNFIGNLRMIRCQSCGHNFDYNYWNKPRAYPKIILGWKGIEIWEWFYIDIPVLMFDYHPASEPYDI